LGCTEPAAVALCSAAAVDLLKDRQFDRLELWVDTNIYKNGMGVAIPGTRGEYGIDLAAALGAVCGDPRLKLEVFEPISEDSIAEARKLIAERLLSCKDLL